MNDSPPTQPNATNLTKSIGKEQLFRAILLLLLIVLMLVGAVPSYLANKWSWANFPTVTNLKAVKSVLSKGLQLPDWNTYVRQITDVGSHRWLIQLIGKTPEKPIVLFLRPQTENPEKIDRLAKPEVDWEDIQGYTQDFSQSPEKWIANLTQRLLEERFEEKLSQTPPNPANGNGSDLLKQEFALGLNQWFQEKFIAEFERQSQKSFTDDFAKPLEASLGITFSDWVDKQLKTALEIGVSAWMKEYYSQPHSDSQHDLKFTIDNNSQSLDITARLFRAWNDKQTFAVVQWYARPDGGNFASSSWFWADQIAQLQDRRVPWIAVCLKIPIEPLGDLNKVEADFKAIASLVQQTLMKTAFTVDGSSNNSKSS
jgi:hypothetical protein